MNWPSLGAANSFGGRWNLKIARNSFAAIFCGNLLGATVYLWIALGDGNVPWAASDYAIFVGLFSIPLSWFSINHKDKSGIMSVVAGVIFTAVALPILFLFLFAMGLPGNEAPTKDQHIAFFVAPFLVSALFITRRPQSAGAIGLAFLCSFMFILLSTQIFARFYIQSAIQRVHFAGGCVLVRRSENTNLDWHKVQSIWEIPFGFVIGHKSYRVSFVAPKGSTEWTYGNMKEVPTEIPFSECSK